MAVKARFNFDLDFDAPPPPAREVKPVAPPPEPEVPTVDLVTHLIQLGEADAKARAEGFEAGRRSAEAQAAQRLADEAARIAQTCRQLLSQQAADRAASAPRPRRRAWAPQGWRGSKLRCAVCARKVGNNNHAKPAANEIWDVVLHLATHHLPERRK